MLKSVLKNLPGLYPSTMTLHIMARLLRGVGVHGGSSTRLSTDPEGNSDFPGHTNQ